jgi:hyperosmotically inducible periplasmic protein
MVRNRFVVGLAVAFAALSIACADTDPGITTAVKSKLAADDNVKAYKIDVDTKDHVVTLTGTVDSSAAKQRAVTLARSTDGVNNVIDNLTVAPGAAATTGTDTVQDRAADKTAAAKDRADAKADSAQKKAGDAMDRSGEVLTDAAITTAVKSKFLADSDVSGMKIDVDTANGVVTLHGTVPSAAEKRRAVQLAKETNGVKSVKDQLKVGK